MAMSGGQRKGFARQVLLSSSRSATPAPLPPVKATLVSSSANKTVVVTASGGDRSRPAPPQPPPISSSSSSDNDDDDDSSAGERENTRRRRVTRRRRQTGCCCGCSGWWFGVVLAFLLINVACLSTIWYPIGMGHVVAFATLLVIPIAVIELWWGSGVVAFWMPWLFYRILFLTFLVFTSIYTLILFLRHGWWLPVLVAQAFLLNLLVILSIRCYLYWWPVAIVASVDGSSGGVVGGPVGGGVTPYFFPTFVWCGFGWFIVLFFALVLHFLGYYVLGQYLFGWQGGFSFLVAGALLDAILLYGIAANVGLLQAVLGLFYSRQFAPPQQPVVRHKKRDNDN